MTKKHGSAHPTFFSQDLIVDPTLDYEARRVALLEAGKKYNDYWKEEVRAAHRAGGGGREIVARFTAITDTLIRNLYQAVSADFPAEAQGSCTLIALGGYGRAELNPRSDIDLMFFYSGKDRPFAEKISERVLYLLWDMGLEVGYSVRTAKDCLEMAERDLTARTALIDSRYLIGNEDVFKEYERTVMKAVLGRDTQKFLREKLEENKKRLAKYGSSVYLLEPNIKEGEGGLRDLHTALWVAQVKFKARSLRELIIKGVINEEDGAEFEDALDYLWRIRNELHFLSPRKNDQINFEYQEKIADFLGYKANRKAPAVEQFMQDYYSHAIRVEHISSMLTTKATQLDEPALKILGYLTRRNVSEGFFIYRGELSSSRSNLFETDPALMMKAFLLSQRHNVQLSLQLKGMIRSGLHLINDRVRRAKSINEDFFEILRNPLRLGQTLREMHHLQFLNRFIPEFGRIFCKVQHDVYHIYTVDIHTLFAVEEIIKLWQGECRDKKPVLTKVAGDIEKRELLLLAVLFHDIGKGEGKDHCNKGADMIPTIARRMGLNKEDSLRLEFLVRSHLQMAHISQRRDLHDENLILQFAKTMGMSENLNMLFLLTFADIKAVGPDVWSEWKGRLLGELYEKTFELLERGDFRQERRSEKVRNRKRKVVSLLEDEYGLRQVKDVLRGATTRYVLSYRSAEIAEHLRVLLDRKEKPLAIKVEKEDHGGFNQITISTLDIPGLFSKITGVMAANGINILGAQIFTLSSGEAIDILQVTSSTGEIISNPEKWLRVETDLTSVVEGRIRVGDLVQKRHRPSFLPEKVRPRFPNRVDIDNLVSEEYTVIDIYAHDKVGLLYLITRTLKELGLYIGLSKISTKVDQVADTFYVQDIFGQKIVLEAKLLEIKEGLLHCLDEEP